MDASNEKTVPPVSDDGYDVYPLHLLDDTKLNGHVVTFTLFFNDVLDVPKIHTSLLTLLSKGDWRKLGGRLKRKPDGRLEIHSPKEFTDKNPPITFTHDDFSTISITEHEVGKHLPKATKLPSSQKISEPIDLLPFAARKDHPKTVDEIISKNLPMIELHVTSFKDATVLGILNPHNLLDAASQLALVQCWSLVVGGKGKYVPPVLGAKEDVLNVIDTSLDASKKATFEKKRLSKAKTLIFVLHFLLSKYRNPPTETRMMYMPKEALMVLQKEAEEGRNGEHVSTNDIFVAWSTKIIASARSRVRPVALIHLLNARGRLPLVDPTKIKGVHLQNMVTLAFTFLSKKQITDNTLGQLALENRKQLASQATEEEVSLFLRATREASKAQKRPNLICGESALTLPLFFNNLTQASPLKAGDFSGALVRPGNTSKDRANPLGFGDFFLHQGVDGYVTLSESFYVFYKTPNGDYWLMATVSDKAWKKFDAELQRLTKVVETHMAAHLAAAKSQKPVESEKVPETEPAATLPATTVPVEAKVVETPKPVETAA